MERLLRIASPLGLYAEEFDPETGRHLGDFPQAFSHLALIEAAARMIVPNSSRISDQGAYDVITLARPLVPSGKAVLITAFLMGGER
jgi:hypothetical protein